MANNKFKLVNKEIVRKLISSSNGEDQMLGLEYLQYLEDEEIEEITPINHYNKRNNPIGYPNRSKIFGVISLNNSILVLGINTIVRYNLTRLDSYKEQYQQLNKNLTPCQENLSIPQNLDK